MVTQNLFCENTIKLKLYDTLQNKLTRFWGEEDLNLPKNRTPSFCCNPNEGYPTSWPCMASLVRSWVIRRETTHKLTYVYVCMTFYLGKDWFYNLYPQILTWIQWDFFSHLKWVEKCSKIYERQLFPRWICFPIVNKDS